MAEGLSEGDREQVETQIFAGRKIQAIKAYRAATGAGLKDAKEAVEALERELRSSTPEKFAAETSGSGCMSSLLLLLVLPALTILAMWAWG